MPSQNDQENEMMLQNENYSHKNLGLETDSQFGRREKKENKQIQDKKEAALRAFSKGPEKGPKK